MKTFDPTQYANTISQINENERIEIGLRLEKALTEAKRLALAIKVNDTSVRSVFLFGSVARANPTSLTFDIDLALDGGDVYKAMDITENSTFSVDIVDLRLLSEITRERILTGGIPL